MRGIILSMVLGLFASFSNADPPRFDCPKEVTILLYDSNVNLTCAVHSSLTLSGMKFSWKLRNNVTTVTLDGEGTEGYYRSVISDSDEADTKLMMLKLNNIFPQHFREYTFEATNSDGTSKHTTLVVLDPASKMYGSGAMKSFLNLPFTVIVVLITVFLSKY